MTTDVKLNLLGGFSLTDGDGSAVRLPAGKGQALLAYLALNPDEAHARGKLAGLLWGDQDEAQARANLSQCLFRLRKALGDDAGGILDADKDSVRLNGDRIAVDALTLRRLAETDPGRAAALCKGPLLEAFATRQEAFEGWVAQERASYANLMEGVLTRHAESRLTAGEAVAAITTARPLVAMNVLNEPAHRLLMRAYAAGGRRDAALQQYRIVEEILRRELDVAPDAATKALFEELQDLQVGDGGEADRGGQRRPSIAVLPFVNLSDDAEQAYFADGMADDLITDLSHISGLVVASRTSSFAYKGTKQKTRQIARELDVQYLLEGSVRRAGDKVRINAQLIDGATGTHLWAETFDHAYENIFALQDAVTARIADALKVKLTPGEREQLARLPTKSLEAYEFFLKAETLRHRGHWETIEPAFGFYDEALARDPDFLDAHLGHAQASFQAWHLAWFAAIDPLEARRRTLESIERALALDPGNAEMLALQVEIQIWLRQNERALELADKAVAMHPDNPDLLVMRALVLTTFGRFEEAQADIARAESADEKLSLQVIRRTAEVHVMSGNYAKAVDWILNQNDENSPFIHRGAIQLIVSYAGLGQMDKARQELRNLSQTWAWNSLAFFRVRNLHYRESVRNRHIGLLAKAGMPEWPHGFQGIPEHRLNDTDLKALFFTGPLLWHRLPPRSTMRSSEGYIDGEGNYWGIQTTRSGKAIPVKGALAARNNMLCMRTESMQLGREYCSEVYRNPEGSAEERTEYFLISFWGKTYFSVEPTEAQALTSI